MEQLKEKWLPIKGYEDFYLISNLGRLKFLGRTSLNGRLFPSEILNLTPSRKGYVALCLYDLGKGKHFFVHRLVAEHFLENPKNFPIVHHKDGNRSNNHVSNLEWVTHKTNNIERFKKEGRFLTIKSNTKRIYPTLDEINQKVNIQFKEEWKDIIGFEEMYRISNTGRVISLARKDQLGRQVKEREIIPSKSWQASLGIPLCKNGIRKYIQASRLVASHFIPNPNNYPIVNHLNGNKLDNRFTNLEWCTHSMNTKHAYDIGIKKGPHWTKSSRRKLNPEDIINIRKRYQITDITQKELSKEYNVNLTNIQSILYRKTWNWIN